MVAFRRTAFVFSAFFRLRRGGAAELGLPRRRSSSAAARVSRAWREGQQRELLPGAVPAGAM